MKKYKIVKVKDFCNSRDYTQFYNARLPICTITSMVDVSRLVKFKNKHKFNAMMVYCMQMAGQKHDVCHYDFKDETSLIRYETVTANFVLMDKSKELRYVTIPYFEHFKDFESSYLTISQDCYENLKDNYVDDCAMVATSAVTNLDLLSMSSGYTDDFVKPFLVWGKIKKNHFKYYLNISFRFHHSIFAGRDIGDFFAILQNEIKYFNPKN